ncbi:MAG: hypothetical protein K6F93_04850 [Lachnospiraceae bacterium]|nr:hypothetical protein [Lachnospiraceae bacterium]
MEVAKLNSKGVMPFMHLIEKGVVQIAGYNVMIRSLFVAPGYRNSGGASMHMDRLVNDSFSRSRSG